jgi:hypothetical protein
MRAIRPNRISSRIWPWVILERGSNDRELRILNSMQHSHCYSNMATANDLPNELIREILFAVLDVPDEMFRDVSLTSPFWRPSHISTSSVLGVCKKWMNIAMPLLYRVVVIRSKAQAYALERTLRQRNGLGTHVKKLRVEGGYGAPMHKIIISAPNITCLCLSLDIRSSDNVKGLCSSLSFTNPSCLVVLTPRDHRANALLRELAATLGRCFGGWTNLVSLPHCFIVLQVLLKLIVHIG